MSKEKQIEEMVEFLNNKINVERNSYFGKGRITISLIEAEKILTLIKELTQAHEMLSESYDHLEKTKDELLAERSRLIEERDTFREYAYNMQKYVENIRHKEEEGYEPSAARYAAEMEMWRVVALEKKELTQKLEIANLEIECKKRICESYALQYGTVADKEVWLKKERADTVQKLLDCATDNAVCKEIGDGTERLFVSIPKLREIAKEMVEGVCDTTS